MSYQFCVARGSSWPVSLNLRVIRTGATPAETRWAFSYVDRAPEPRDQAFRASWMHRPDWRSRTQNYRVGKPTPHLFSAL
jgi:hypothetical protein